MLATSSGSAILPSACLAAISRSAASLSPVACKAIDHEAGSGVAGGDGIDPDTERPLLECERDRQSEYARLCGGIGKCPGLGQGRLDGSHVDDRSASALPHARKDGARTQPHRAQVDGEERIPVVRRHRNRVEAGVHAGVVDEHVDRTELCLDSGERLRDVSGRADIAPREERAAGRAARTLGVEVERGDTRARLTERSDGRRADAAGAPGDGDHGPAEPLLGGPSAQDLRL